jgi:hypothetical protein
MTEAHFALFQQRDAVEDEFTPRFQHHMVITYAPSPEPAPTWGQQ